MKKKYTIVYDGCFSTIERTRAGRSFRECKEELLKWARIRIEEFTELRDRIEDLTAKEVE
jgi:hypothetical protein